jgi:hypothetical protein
MRIQGGDLGLGLTREYKVKETDVTGLALGVERFSCSSQPSIEQFREERDECHIRLFSLLAGSKRQ